MRIWKQLFLCLVLLVVALGLWIYLVPTAGDRLARYGVPVQAIAMIRPTASANEAASGSSDTQQAGTGRRVGGQRGAGEGRATLVSVRPVGTGTVNDRLSAIGSGEAIQSVVVMPQASGTIEEIMVTSGQKVKKGDILARLDDDEQQIERDKAQVMLKSAQEKSASYKNLQSVARLDVLDAQIAEQSAKLALSTAELNLGRRNITAPIDGIAGIVAVNIGDNVTTQTNIVTIDDRSAILVDFWAPERFAVAIEPGQPVEATAIARPGQTFAGRIEAIDNRLDPASRTMRIRARVDNSKDELRAGMAFGVTMRFEGEQFSAVDPLAIQWDGEGAYVWQVRDGKSFKTRVRIVQRNTDTVLIEAELKEGDKVAIEGLQRVREGGAVRIAGAGADENAEVAGQ